MIDFNTNYMDEALFGLPALIERTKTELADVDFDTIVGTGFSGGVVIPALAMALGKNFVLIRKEGDDSHHGGGRLLGSLGKRWIFLDDFVSSGATRTRVLEKVENALLDHGSEATYVGDYLYAQTGPERRLVLADPNESLVAQDDGPAADFAPLNEADVRPLATVLDEYVAGLSNRMTIQTNVALAEAAGLAKPCQDYSAAGTRRRYALGFPVA